MSETPMTKKPRVLESTRRVAEAVREASTIVDCGENLMDFGTLGHVAIEEWNEEHHGGCHAIKVDKAVIARMLRELEMEVPNGE